jgi:hypothetical protein
LELLLLTVTLLLIGTLGVYRLLCIYKRPILYQPRTRIHLLVLSLSGFAVLLPPIQMIYVILSSHSSDSWMPSFKYFFFGGLIATWLAALILVEVENSRGLKYGKVVILFWISVAFITSLRVQAYVNENLHSSVVFIFVVVELVISIVLCIISLLFNKSRPLILMQGDLTNEMEDYYRYVLISSFFFFFFASVFSHVTPSDFSVDEDSDMSTGDNDILLGNSIPHYGSEVNTSENGNHSAKKLAIERVSEEDAFLFLRYTFRWVSPLLVLGMPYYFVLSVSCTGTKRPILTEDLPRLVRDDDIEPQMEYFRIEWDKEKLKSNPSLSNTLIRIHLKDFVFSGIC